MFDLFIPLILYIAGVAGYVETKEDDSYDQHAKNMVFLGGAGAILALMVQVEMLILPTLVTALPSLVVLPGLPALFPIMFFLVVLLEMMVWYAVGALFGKIVKVVEGWKF